MPLYIKLDVGTTGLVYAWVTNDRYNFGGVAQLISVASGRTAAQTLRSLAKQIPLPKKEDKNA